MSTIFDVAAQPLRGHKARSAKSSLIGQHYLNRIHAMNRPGFAGGWVILQAVHAMTAAGK